MRPDLVCGALRASLLRLSPFLPRAVACEPRHALCIDFATSALTSAQLHGRGVRVWTSARRNSRHDRRTGSGAVEGLRALGGAGVLRQPGPASAARSAELGQTKPVRQGAATLSDRCSATQHAETLRSLIAQMPMTNSADEQAGDVDHAALLNSIRSRYRLFCSAAGIRPRVHAAQSL